MKKSFGKAFDLERSIKMRDLQMIENELVPVYQTNTGEKVVYGTELHRVLEVKSRYREWIDRRFSDIEAVENEDYEAAEISAPSGQPRKEHIIRLDVAKEMSMLERNEKGKQVRRYFIEVEKKYKERPFEGISPELKAVLIVDKRISQVENRVNVLEDKMVIDYNQQRVLRDKISITVLKWLGGKESKAYRSISKKVFSECNHDFQNYFRVNSRNNTPKCRFEEALTYVEQWEPCHNTKILIRNSNMSEMC